MQNYSVQFLCGCLSGWAQVLTMQPFQMIKVRLANQSLLNPIYKGIGDCLRKIYSQEGISAFYKGTLSPLLGIGAQVAMQFGTNALVKKILWRFNQQDYDQNQNTTSQKLPMSFVFLSGLLTGVPSSLIATPVDHMRIQMQNKQSKKYKSSINAGIQISKKHGIKGLYLGFVPTMVREVMALGVYFGSYEALVRSFNKQQKNGVPTLVSFMSGGMAGSLSWLMTYPVDYIKTIIQSDDLDKRKYKSALHAAMLKYEQQGIKTFFKGLGVTMLRSFPVNGIGFVTFQYFRHKLSRSQQI